MQRLSLQYHSPPLAALGISAIAGVNRTTLAFGTDSKTLTHASVTLEGGLCYSLELGSFGLRADTLMASNSTLSLTLGAGYAF